ncbi:MAG TPA: hypothetical protein VF111_08015 [Thermoanaerobaculia bacterium]
MRTPTSLAALVLLSIAAAWPCSAQDLDIFELSDFVDPRLRGLEMDTELEMTEQGADYQFFRAIVGGVTNYTARTKPTGNDIGFVHLAGSYYSGLRQYNLKLTTLEVYNKDDRPRFRVAAQVAHYSFSMLEDEEEGAQEQYADRYLYGLSLEESEKCDDAGLCKRRLDSELGVMADSSLLPGNDTELIALIFALRDTAAEGFVIRGTIAMRLLDIEGKGRRARYSMAIEHSIERSRNSIHLGTTRLGIGWSWRVVNGMTLNAAWQPTYSPSDRGTRIRHEFGLFLDSTIYSRLVVRNR